MRFSYLVQRGNLYYFQCRVPADIKRYFPGTQIRKSLKTANRKHALTLVKGLVAKTERIFFMARSGILTPKLIKHLVQEYMDLMLDTDKQERYGIAETPLDVAVLEMCNDFHSRQLMDSRQDYELTSESGEEETMSGAENLAFLYRSRGPSVVMSRLENRTMPKYQTMLLAVSKSKTFRRILLPSGCCVMLCWQKKLKQTRSWRYGLNVA